MKNWPNSRTAELDAITAYTELICNAITCVASISWFVQKLEECHLITSHASSEVLVTGGYSPEEQCHHLMNAVKVQIRVNPGVFSKFLSIFKSEAALQVLADTIQNAMQYRELKTCILILLSCYTFVILGCYLIYVT